MDQTIPFSPNVMLIDASYINKVGTDLADYFSKQMNREFPKADLALLLECMAMDAGIPQGDNEIQVIFIYGNHAGRMNFCTPSSLTDEIHGKAFKGVLGEISLYAFQPSQLATCEDLFLEALQLSDASDKVQRVIVVPDEWGYSTRVTDYLKNMKGKERVCFGMTPQTEQTNVSFKTIGMPLLAAYHIRPEEL